MIKKVERFINMVINGDDIIDAAYDSGVIRMTTYELLNTMSFILNKELKGE